MPKVQLLKVQLMKVLLTKVQFVNENFRGVKYDVKKEIFKRNLSAEKS